MGQVPDDLKQISAVEAEVEALRERTQRIVAELENRLRARAEQAKETFQKVKRVVDVKEQLREHPAITITVGTVAALALGLGVYAVVHRLMERRRPLNRLKARGAAYRALLADPWRALRKKEPLGKRLLAAVLVAGATTIVRGLSAIMVKRTIAPRMLPPHEAEELRV